MLSQPSNVKADTQTANLCLLIGQKHSFPILNLRYIQVEMQIGEETLKNLQYDKYSLKIQFGIFQIHINIKKCNWVFD